ncbi:MAG: hypothetical protein M3203_16610, partial [Actinomycetota bacterium]|nr:hypothetical protein [Actinomycetota bacterium]
MAGFPMAVNNEVNVAVLPGTPVLSKRSAARRASSVAFAFLLAAAALVLAVGPAGAQVVSGT